MAGQRRTMKKLLVVLVAVLLIQATLAKSKKKKKDSSDSSDSSESSEKKLSKKCPPVQNQVLVIREVTVCNLDQKKLTCPQGSTIQIHEAFYGRKNTYTCSCHGSSDGRDVNGVCSSPDALQVVNNRCTGQRECDLAYANSWLSDPCTGTDKYLEVSFSCSTKQPRQGKKKSS